MKHLSVEDAIEQIKEMYGEEPESFEVISFIQDNYEEITGNDRSEMYAEQEFDYEVVEIAEECGVDYDTLCEEW